MHVTDLTAVCSINARGELRDFDGLTPFGGVAVVAAAAASVFFVLVNSSRIALVPKWATDYTSL